MISIVHVLILNGSVGVGKTRTAEAVSGLLTKDSVANAVVDLDCLRRAYPRPRDDPFHMSLGFKNLAAIWPNYHNLGISHLIIPSVVEDISELTAFADAVPNSSTCVIRLTAPIEVIHRRLEQREVGQSLARHKRRASELNDQLAASDVGQSCLNTKDKSVAQVAREVLSIWNRSIKG